MLPGRWFVWVPLLLAACGDDGGPVDAAIVPVDIDNGSCGSEINFTGEYVDWDDDARFCGINNATVRIPGGGMANTAPNGRFLGLCVPDAPTTRLDVTQPSGNSQCTTPPAGYSVPVILIANKQVIQSGAMFSARAFTTARQPTFFTMVGQPFDSAKAQVFVHVDGAARVVSLDAAHGPTQAVITTTWAAGDSGHDVFFPNVDVGAGTTMLSVLGGAIGTGSVPLVAGTITNVTVKTPANG